MKRPLKAKLCEKMNKHQFRFGQKKKFRHRSMTGGVLTINETSKQTTGFMMYVRFKACQTAQYAHSPAKM